MCCIFNNRTKLVFFIILQDLVWILSLLEILPGQIHEEFLKGQSYISNSNALVLENEERDKRKYFQSRKMTDVASDGLSESTVVYRTVLTIRVNAADLSTTVPTSKLTEKIYGSNLGFSLRSQYEACSLGKLVFIPFEGATKTGEEISNGIGEVNITNNANGTSAILFTQVVESATTKKYGDLGSQFDNVIFCLPPETVVDGDKDWMGFAFYNHWLASINDLYCSYPSALMHEVGHNLGLAHSDKDYGDTSCMMGYSYKEEDGPKMCFNGAKSWELGWYSDGHLSINVNGLTDWEHYSIDLTGVANFDRRLNQTVIIQITGTSNDVDYYIAFNRKIGFNSGTREGGDQVLITSRQARQNSVDSTLEALMIAGDDFFIHSVGKKSDVLIHVENLSFFAYPAYASVHIAKYHEICYSDDYCNDFDSCTVDTCDFNLVQPGFPTKSGSCVHETMPCTECGARISVRVDTNVYPKDTSWTIVNVDKKMEVFSGGPYSEQNTTYDTHKCLELGNYRFNFVVKSIDKASHSEYTLSIQSSEFTSSKLNFANDSNFEQSEEKIFSILCTEEECVDHDACTADIYDPETRLCVFEPLETCVNATKFNVELTTDEFPEETTWAIINLNDRKVVGSGGPYLGFGRKKKSRRRLDYDEGGGRNNSHVIELNLDKGLYEFVINDSFGDGM